MNNEVLKMNEEDNEEAKKAMFVLARLYGKYNVNEMTVNAATSTSSFKLTFAIEMHDLVENEAK